MQPYYTYPKRGAVPFSPRENLQMAYGSSEVKNVLPFSYQGWKIRPKNFCFRTKFEIIFTLNYISLLSFIMNTSWVTLQMEEFGFRKFHSRHVCYLLPTYKTRVILTASQKFMELYFLNVLQMISYVPTSLAWPSPSPKKTQDPKTLTYKVKHFLPPYQKKWKKGKQKAEEPLSGKDRLMVLLLAEKAATRVALKPSSSFRPTTAAYDLETSSTETETSQKNGLFQVCRYLELKTCFTWQWFGLWLLQSLRQSFRRKKISILRQQHPGDISHDSGLGEDSDSPLSPRTSPLTPILRTPSCNCNSKPLKQVMIREPSLKHLPSAIRNSYPGAMPADKPQLVKLQHRHYRYSYHADNMVGDVSGQWNSLYFRAAQEVRLRQGGCDKVNLRLGNQKKNR